MNPCSRNRDTKTGAAHKTSHTGSGACVRPKTSSPRQIEHALVSQRSSLTTS